MGVTHAVRVHTSHMKTIQIRNVPEDVHARLRQRALAAGLSLSDYALAELELVARRGSNAEVLMRAASRDAPVTVDDIVGVIRAARPDR
jgi:predicted CopG family antitoxin